MADDPLARHADLGSAPEQTFDHPVRGRFNAWFFSVFDRYIDRVARPLKHAAFAELRADRVLELGPGIGANLGYLPAGAELIAVEPNLRMHAALERRCARAGVALTLVPSYADRLPLPDQSVDEVICSLVLCTVPDPDAVLGEVARVLRPGGRFRFVEHVAAPPGTRRAAVQRVLRRPWSWVFEGCDLHRDTADAIERAGFAATTIVPMHPRGSVFYPVNTMICGVAQR
ncbi:MAG: class I SAM-dependent methyltransferase [Micropruina sp.]|uniref:class I SAM-dependent methyltransferase n=1 Tax=Micropruina sp. TaxID=2737536 RepID=UPI0039E55EC6